jgi:beta-lactamase superfamily II metal-dependent hydrolase
MAKKRRKRRRKTDSKRNFRILLVVVFIVSGFLGYIVSQNRHWLDTAAGWPNAAWQAILGFFNDMPPNLPDGEILVHFIDVGQGDAVLVQTAAGAMLIDGGDNPMGRRVMDYLRGVGISELTYVIATHPHADHIGGLVTVLNEMPVGTVIMPPRAHTTRTFERFLDALEQSPATVREPVVGANISLGDAVFTIIAPNNTGDGRGINDYSIGLRLDFGATSFIFTGDAEVLSETEMLAAGHNLRADVLHVGHHGSTTSTTQDFLSAVNPSIAVISVGADNGFGHPHGAVMNRLNNAGIRIYRTDIHGNIIIATDGINLHINHN